MGELAISDVERAWWRFVGDPHGELGELTAGHEEYYEREVAGGAEDYYAMRGEAAGERMAAAPRPSG